MDGLPLVIGRLQHDFRMWGDVDGPRSLHLFGHYALIFEASCESFRLGEPRAPNLVDEAANLGATAWWALDKHSASPISEEAIVSSTPSRALRLEAVGKHTRSPSLSGGVGYGATPPRCSGRQLAGCSSQKR